MTTTDPAEKIAHTDRGQHVDVRRDGSGNVQFDSSTGGSPTASTGSATSVTTKVTTTGVALFTQFKSIKGTATGTASVTVKFSRDGSSLDSTTSANGGATTITPTTQTTRLTANSPTWTFRISATTSTGLTVSGTVSKESRL